MPFVLSQESKSMARLRGLAHGVEAPWALAASLIETLDVVSYQDLVHGDHYTGIHPVLGVTIVLLFVTGASYVLSESDPCVALRPTLSLVS
jgi:hypothetical protein